MWGTLRRNDRRREVRFTVTPLRGTNKKQELGYQRKSAKLGRRSEKQIRASQFERKGRSRRGTPKILPRGGTHNAPGVSFYTVT